MGQIPHRLNIVSITNSLPCEVTTEVPHEFRNHSFVRLTDLNGMMPDPRGMNPLNNYKFRVVITGDETFYLEDPITFQPIDSTNYPPYVTGGSCNLVETEFYYYGDDEE
jgi:hypothetical protein